jgi:hypothetical protein
MLAVSLALHGFLAGGVALTGLGTGHWKKADPQSEQVTLTLIAPAPRPEPLAPTPVPVKPVEYHPVVVGEPPPSVPPPPAAAAPIAEAGLPVLPKTKPPEPNPNADLPVVPSETVLAPVPAPKLEGSNGVVFLLDISGSMYEPYAGSTRLTYARQALSRRLRAMPDGTPFAVVLYAQRACASGPLVAASEATREAAVRFLMRDIDCGGGTNLPAGLSAAEALHTGAIVLATDGDLNISVPELKRKAGTIMGAEGRCPFLTIVGVGPRADTTADALLQSLADQQGGSYRVEQTAEETAWLNPGKAAR